VLTNYLPLSILNQNLCLKTTAEAVGSHPLLELYQELKPVTLLEFQNINVFM